MPTLTTIVPATNRPPTLARCTAAIRGALDPPEELIVVEEPAGIGPARARNDAARRATGDVLVFVDSDVEVHADAFVRIRHALAGRPELAAVFGAYDDAPDVRGVVSTFRNLLHHHVHASAAGEAATFWAGLGAVRKDDFLRLGGFDEVRYSRPSVEDIDLGLRLAKAGLRIELDPSVRGTHLKRWTVAQMVRTDLLDRGAPWTELLLRHRFSGSSALNLGWRHRLSAAAALALAVGVARRRTAVAGAAGVLLLILNRRFYALLVRRRGPLEAAAGVGLHVVHHLTAVAAVPLGVARFLIGEYRSREPRRG